MADQFEEAVRQTIDFGRAASGRAIVDMDDDPEQAAKSMKLSEATGVPAPVIHNDFEHFSRSTASRISNEIIKNNQHLQDYIASNPMASKVSNDDWHNLDKFSQTLKRGVEPERHPIWGAIPDIIDSFKEFGQSLANLGQQPEVEEQQDQVLIDNLVGHGWDPNAAKVEAGIISQRMARGKALQTLIFGPGVVAAAPVLGTLGLGGFLAGQGVFRQNISRPLEEATGFPKESTEQAAMVILGAVGLPHLAGESKAKITVRNIKDEHQRVLDQLQEIHDAVAPYVEAGEEPPIGIHPIVDKFKINQAKSDAEALGNELKDAQATSTRERSPELLSDFARQANQTNISISADAIREIYGEKEPHPEDNLLGWVPDIVNRLREAEATGGDVEISRADLLSKMDPELWNELKDNIRFRPGGVTIEEGKQLETPEGRPIGIENSVRAQAGLDPVFSDKISNLRLKKVAESTEYRTIDRKEHTFAITDQLGRPVGQLLLAEREGGKEVYVEWIGGANANSPSNMAGVNAFGPRLIMDLGREVAKQFPDADFITGHRVTGAREKAGVGAIQDTGMVRIPLKALREEHFDQLRELFGSSFKELGGGAEYSDVVSLTQKQQKAVDAALAVVNRLVPGRAEVVVGEQVKVRGRPVSGAFVGEHFLPEDALPIIALSLESPDIVGTAKHEVGHLIKKLGVWTDDEWVKLEDAALNNGWMEKYDIDRRYPKTKLDLRLEEAVVEEFARWKREPVSDHPFAKIFQKLKDILDEIRLAIKEAFGYEPTWQELFAKAERGVPEGKARSQGEVQAQQPQLPGIIQDQIFEKAKAIGMTEAQYRRILNAMDKEDQADIRYQENKALRKAKREQTKTWKENEAKTRTEVEATIDNRPDVGVAKYFGQSMLYGEKLKSKPKISPDSLTEEQKNALPKDLVADGGVSIDDVAGLFGYQSSDKVVSEIVRQREAQGEMGLTEWVRKEVDAEVSRRMEKKYGNLSQNILNEAAEHVLNPTTLDRLHEETVGAAERAGVEFPFTQKDVKSWAEDSFGNEIVGNVKANKFLNDSGRAGRKQIDALLSGKFSDAFKLQQQKQFAALKAAEANKFENEISKDLKLLEQYAQKPFMYRVADDYTAQIHDLLRRVGFEIKRADANLDANLKEQLYDFIERKNGAGAGILEPNLPRKTRLDDFTVDEYRDFIATVRSLDYNGRQEQIIKIGAREADFARGIDGIGANLEKLEKKGFDPAAKGTVGATRRIIREVDARLVKQEQLADWIDHNNPLGWFNQSVIRPMFETLHRRGDIIAELAKNIKAIPVDRAWGKSLNNLVDHKYFREKDGSGFVKLTRENMIVMALNWGNKSNRSVLSRGHEWSDAYINHFFKNTDHMTKMDWDFVQGIWRVFDKIAPLVEEATQKRSGVPIKMIEPMDVQTKFGTMKGGYYPLVEDSRYRQLKEQVETDLVDKPYFPIGLPMARAMHLRTGVAYPLDLSLGSLNSRINETLHTALFHDPVMNARKVIGNATVRKGIANAFGPEYVKQFDVWLRDIANNGGEKGFSDDWANFISRNARENVVFGLMGYKASTAFIHALSAGTSSVYEAGTLPMIKAMKELGLAQALPDVARRFFKNEKEMWEQVDWAHNNIPELRNRMQDIGRDMQAQLATIVNKGFLDDAARFRAANIAWGMKVIATLDQLTATPVGLAAYKKARAEGASHEDATYIAGKVVRQAHGSPSLVGRANIGRGEVQKWLTVAYNGYWNHNYNRIRSAVRDIKAPDIEFSDRLMIGASTATALVLAPAIYHFAFRTAIPQGGSDNYAVDLGESVLSQFGGQVPFVNTMLYAMMHNKMDVHMSPIDEIYSTWLKVQHDISQKANGKKAENWLQHALEAPGFLAGIGPSHQLATTIQFNKDVLTGKETPKPMMEWVRGELFTGHAEPQKRR